jgi:hypothetical protein
MWFNKEVVAEREGVNSYLFEVFKLNPEFSDIYCKITEDKTPEAFSMDDFFSRQYPASPVMMSLSKALAPYLELQEALALGKLRYTEAVQLTNHADQLENLSPEERTLIKRAQDDLPQIIANLQTYEKAYTEEKTKLAAQLTAILTEANTLEKQQYENRREQVYLTLDNLKIPRNQFTDKRIDNPLRFRSYGEAYDYLERQTSIDRTKIPIKNWQSAAHDYVVFQQLIVYLAVMDCLLPLGINYDN